MYLYMKTWPFPYYQGLNLLNTKLKEINLTVTEIKTWLNLNSVGVWDQSCYPYHLDFLVFHGTLAEDLRTSEP